MWINRAKLRLQRLARRRQLDRDLEDELRFHLDMLAQDHPDPRRRFGNLTALKERCREMSTLGSLEILWQDVRYAARMLRRNPAFTVVAVLTLTLAIGANTAIFSVVNGVMLRALPYRDAGRLALLWTSAPKDREEESITSVPNFLDWKAQSRAFEIVPFRGLGRFLPVSPLIMAAGLGVEAMGLLLAIWARRHLGRNWSGEITIKVDHQLIRSGPYSLLRHPIYTGLLAMYAGTALVTGEWLAVIGFAMAAFAYWRKIRLEEANLNVAFGTDYDVYRRETWALVPGLF